MEIAIEGQKNILRHLLRDPGVAEYPEGNAVDARLMCFHEFAKFAL